MGGSHNEMGGQYGPPFHCGCGRDSQRMTVHAAFAKELTGAQNPDHSLLVLLGYDREFDLALLNVKHRVRDVALRENVFILFKFEDRLARAQFFDP